MSEPTDVGKREAYVAMLVIALCMPLTVLTIAGIKVSHGNPFLVFVVIIEALVIVGMVLRLCYAMQEDKKNID